MGVGGVGAWMRSLTAGCTLLKYYSTHTHQHIPNSSLNTEAPTVKAGALENGTDVKTRESALDRRIKP